MGSGLPRAGLQRVTDGAVSLDGNGHEAEGGDADGDPCRKEKTSNEETFRELLCCFIVDNLMNQADQTLQTCIQ